MGCGMSKSNLMDEGMGVFASRNPGHHHKTNTASPNNLLFTNTSKTSIVHQPPVLQKININDNDGRKISNDDQMWIGSPSFREYVQSLPGEDDFANKGDGQGEEIVTSTHGGKTLTYNREVCVWVDRDGNERSENKDTGVGRFRKVFQVHRAISWHGGGVWHPGHPKATRKAA